MKLAHRKFRVRNLAIVIAVLLAASFMNTFARPTLAQSPTTAELAQASPLGDMILGVDSAPVTVIEYASMTCDHCANFHVKVWPIIKTRYVDTGKMRYILREFPSDPLASVGAGAFMLARCASKNATAKYFVLVETFFRRQKDWAVEDPIPPLRAIAKSAGFTDERFNQCLADKKLLDGIQQGVSRAQKLGIKAAPTFFINGHVAVGDIPLADFEKLIGPHLN